MKRITISILITLTTLAIIWILWQLRSIILLFVLSLAIAATLHKPIKVLITYRLPRMVAMGIVYGITLFALVGLVAFISIPIGSEIESLAETSVSRYEHIQATTETPEQRWRTDWRTTFMSFLPPLTEVETLFADNDPSALFWGVLGLTSSIAGLAAQTLVAIALSVYWTADQMHFERLWLSLLPAQRRTGIRQLWRKMEGSVGAYIRSEVIQSVVAGSLLTLGFYFMGTDYPYLMALLGAVAWFIPLVGGGLGLLLVTALAALDGLWFAGMVAVYTVGIYLLMEYYLEPKLYRRERYSSILVILVMLALLYALGLLGLLIAPPIALILQILLDELLLPAARSTPSATEIEENWTALEAQVTQLQTTLGEQAETSLRINSLTQRLKELVAEARR